MCFSTHKIVIGRFEGVLRYAYTPFSAKMSADQNTLYSFRVESYLKGHGEPRVKIYYPGGPLPWNNDGSIIEGAIFAGNPIPSVGDRYLLFLEEPGKKFPVDQYRGYASKFVNGKREITQYLDELSFVSPLRSKILLRNGMALSGDLSGSNQHLHWRFATGLQIIDITERQAIANIRKVLGEIKQD